MTQDAAAQTGSWGRRTCHRGQGRMLTSLGLLFCPESKPHSGAFSREWFIKEASVVKREEAAKKRSFYIDYFWTWRSSDVYARTLHEVRNSSTCARTMISAKCVFLAGMTQLPPAKLEWVVAEGHARALLVGSDDKVAFFFVEVNQSYLYWRWHFSEGWKLHPFFDGSSTTRQDTFWRKKVPGKQIEFQLRVHDRRTSWAWASFRNCTELMTTMTMTVGVICCSALKDACIRGRFPGIAASCCCCTRRRRRSRTPFQHDEYQVLSRFMVQNTNNCSCCWFCKGGAQWRMLDATALSYLKIVALSTALSRSTVAHWHCIIGFWSLPGIQFWAKKWKRCILGRCNDWMNW